MEIDTINSVRLILGSPFCGPDIVKPVVQNEKELSIFPNPSEGIFYLEFTELPKKHSIDLYIFNILGSMIYTRSLQPESNRYTLDISFADPGLYFLTIMQDGLTKTGKLIIY